MNINQIKYVLAVAGSSSMREAAAKLFVSQPALSVSIRELEEELGILIFERNSKGISLTDEGREFVEYAKKAVGQYGILEERYLSNNKNRERFSVSTQHYNFAVKAFAETIRRCKPEQYLFAIRETKTKEVLEDVRTLRSEVGVVSFSEGSEALMKKLFREYQLTFVPLMQRDTYIYVWENHPLAAASEVSLEELREYPCISFDQSDDSDYYLTEEAMADREFERMIRSDDRATTMELIADLGGYSVGTGMLSGDDAILKGLVAIKLKENDPLVIGYITRTGSPLSAYGSVYVEEILRYKEL